MRRAVLAALMVIGVGDAQEASLIVTNGRIWTGEASQPWAEAIAVTGSRIAAVGSQAEIRKHAGKSTRTIDANGAMITPGFIDSHVHFIEGGFRLSSVQLRDAKTRDQFIARIRDYAKTVPAGTWISGGDWDHSLWGGELPSRQWIDAVTPEHPVWVNRLDGHMALANSKALAMAGVIRSTPAVNGGEIVRDANGDPTGVLKDNAMALVEKHVPDPPDALKDRALAAAMAYVASHGVTSVHHMGSWPDLAVFERARKSGTLRTRIYAAVPLSSWERLKRKVDAEGRGDEWLRIGALKGFVDGSLGSHTAAFLAPFADAPNDKGLLVNSAESLYEWTAQATKAGLHPMVHAIGDRAIRTQLDIFERVMREQNPKDPRFRIEHAQHIAPGDIPRFGKLGVIASMQPYHAIDDGRWAEKVIGPERIKTTYAFRNLLESGAKVAFGSDWFVAPPTPLEGVYAAVTRRTLDDRHPNGWVPAQKISAEQALSAYTREAAFASFEESSRGSLKTGKLADFVMIDGDITRMAPEKIREARILMTVAGGTVIYERK
jgi:predicted amidohydrolase YtcJ